MPRSRRPPPEEYKPASLGGTARNHSQLIVWCKGCRHHVIFMPEDIARFATSYGDDTILLEWARRLRCSKCGSADVDSVVSGNG
jgi:hypothetical protein